MYRVSEIAKILGVTRATVYNKVKSLQEELKPYIYIKKGIKHIDNRGLEIIRNSLAVNQSADELTDDFTTYLKEHKTDVDKTIENTVDRQSFDNRINTLQNDYIDSLKDHIQELKQEVQVKNDQLERKDELIRNFQILLKEDKDRILLLEEKLEEKEIAKDQQSVITKEIMEQVKEENKKLMDYIVATREYDDKKSFWSKLFGK